jgi:hypothetical protein
MGWRAYPWAAVPFVLAAIIVLHPVMNKDLPSLIGADMLRSPRTYIAVALSAAAEIISAPYWKAFQDHFPSGH